MAKSEIMRVNKKKALVLDFYETVVHEDDEVIKVICERILQTGNPQKPTDISTYWWNCFQDFSPSTPFAW